VLIVAHRLSTIESADKIIVLENGRLVEQGNHRELIRRKGLYAHLVNKQLHSNKDEATTPTKSGASTPKASLNQSLSYFSTIDNQPTTEF
jgi:ATP-binding cassette subfamily B multidrug efflux pump